MATNICIVCRENDGKHAMKACCGHIVYLCDDCSFERKRVQHEKCDKCCGRLTAEEERLQDDAIVRDYEDALYSSLDSYESDWEAERAAEHSDGLDDLDFNAHDLGLDDHVPYRGINQQYLPHEDTGGHVDVPKGRLVEPEDIGEIVDEDVGHE